MAHGAWFSEVAAANQSAAYPDLVQVRRGEEGGGSPSPRLRFLARLTTRPTLLPSRLAPARPLSPSQERDFPSWNAFFNRTNHALAPYELCDCTRPFWAHHDERLVMRENRYFRDPSRSSESFYSNVDSKLMPSPASLCRPLLRLPVVFYQLWQAWDARTSAFA